MKKAFQHVCRAADRLDEGQQEALTYFDVREVARDLHDGLITAGEVEDRLARCIEVNEALNKRGTQQ